MAVAPTPRTVDLAVTAEHLGYQRCWFYDEGFVTRDVYVTMAAVALRTERLLVGTGITNPYVRHPGTTAAAVATLDELSGGRAFVGVGAGGSLTMGPMAIERRSPARAVKDMVAAMRSLFAGDAVDLDGEVVRFAGARLGWGRPGIEIWVAGRGRRILDAGARFADGVLLSYVHKDFLGPSVAALRRAAVDRPVRISYTTALVTDDASFESARAELTFRIVDSPRPVQERLGVSEGELAALRAGLERGGPRGAAEHVRPEWVPQFALVGDRESIAAELAALAARHGIDEFQVAVHDPAVAEAQMELGMEILTAT